MFKRAEAGIGTLILFIALTLVAAVAAGVLISTSSSLQSKALFTGSKAQAQVSTQAVPLYLYGKDALTTVGGNRIINRSFLKLKLAPGSEPITLTSSLLQVDTKNTKASLTYSSSVNCTRESGMVNGLFNATNYNIYYGMKSLIGNGDQYLERSDVIELCFALPENVGEGQDIRVMFQPKVGSPTLVESKTPDVMLTQQVKLFP